VAFHLSNGRLFPYFVAERVHGFRSELIRDMRRALSANKYQVPLRRYLKGIRSKLTNAVVQHAAEALYRDMMNSLTNFKPMLLDIATLPGGLDQMDAACRV
jgi:hypothetical protein